MTENHFLAFLGAKELEIFGGWRYGDLWNLVISWVSRLFFKLGFSRFDTASSLCLYRTRTICSCFHQPLENLP